MSKSKPTGYLYLCSSARHLYLAIGMAINEPEVEHHMILIGQKVGRAHALSDSLKRDSSLFKSFDVFYDNEGLVKRYFGKRSALREVAQAAKRIKPLKVFVGNDRHLEFQYTMVCLRASGLRVTGVYIDDGTGSYLSGRYMTGWGAFTDRYVDRPLKKLLYGGWCERVPQLGGTKWVDQCYLTFPDLAPERIKRDKHVLALSPAWYKSQKFIDVLKRMLESQEDALNLNTISSKRFDALLILPLKKFVVAQCTSVEDYNSALKKYLKKFNSVAIKYHPREQDFYFDSDIPVSVLPASLPAELLFSLIEVRYVVGDSSSAVLSAVWLFPEVPVVSLWPAHTPFPPIMKIIERASVVIERI